tara:strand:+ start:4269 stop:6569 length:2301 start_codon:yes stop_codon:yes gene_type:complete
MASAAPTGSNTGTDTRTDTQKTFDPQSFIMSNWDWFVNQSMARNNKKGGKYKYLMPVHANNAFDVNQKFLGTSGIRDLMQIRNVPLSSHLMMKPIIKFYKVFPHSGVEIEIPLTHIRSAGKTDDGGIDKSSIRMTEDATHAGLVEFSWNRTGQTAVEWKTQIAANLRIFLQSPALLEKDIAGWKHPTKGMQFKKTVNGKTYTSKYIDLLYRESSMKENPNIANPQHPTYGDLQIPNPDYYQIKMEFEYKYDPSEAKDEIDSWFQRQALKNLVKKLKTTIFLHPESHDIDFGSALTDPPPMIINIKYIGHISNVLSQVGIFQKSEENATNPYGGIILENYDKIMRRLLESDKIWVSGIQAKKGKKPVKNKAGKTEQQDIITFTLKTAKDPTKAGTTQEKMASETKKGQELKADALLESLLKQRKGLDFSLKWFYFGDLIDVVLKYAYENASGDLEASLKDIRFLLGPMIVKDKNNVRWSLNICDLPISLETFMVWFQEKVINVKTKKFTVSGFLRNVFNSLIRGSYGPMARKEKEFKSPQLSFTTFSLPTIKQECQVFQDKTPGVDVIYARNIETLDSLKTHKTDKKEKYLHYYLIYSNYESRFSFQAALNKHGDVDEIADSARGIAHIKGVRHGPITNIKFKKTDTPGLGTANIVHAGSGQGVLRGIYNADLKTSGYPIFNPGMLIYINPYELKLGRMNQESSLAQKLGMGGYYTIREASFKWSIGKFNGDLDCAWQTFGTEGSTVRVFGSGPIGDPSQISTVEKK